MLECSADGAESVGVQLGAGGGACGGGAGDGAESVGVQLGAESDGAGGDMRVLGAESAGVQLGAESIIVKYNI